MLSSTKEVNEDEPLATQPLLGPKKFYVGQRVKISETIS